MFAPDFPEDPAPRAFFFKDGHRSSAAPRQLAANGDTHHAAPDHNNIGGILHH